METRIPGFRGEYLWELDVPQIQLLALAEAVPAESYGWRPAEGTRTFSAVLVHLSAGNLMLLRLAGMPAPGDGVFESVEGDLPGRLVALVRRSRSLESAITDKTQVIALLRRSFEGVRHVFTAASDEELERTGMAFGEPATVRRIFMRMLAHSHEHMGQAIAYARSMGVRMPWPDPIEEIDRLEAGFKSAGAG